MAQRRLSRKPVPQKFEGQKLEIEERDQANNLVATYIQSFKKERDESNRINVIVSESNIGLTFDGKLRSLPGPKEFKHICEEHSECVLARWVPAQCYEGLS